jgi:hypothetical protein
LLKLSKVREEERGSTEGLDGRIFGIFDLLKKLI